QSCQSSMMGSNTAVLIYWLLGFCVLVFADVWKVQVESEVKALVRSCVVLPCSFKYPGAVQPSSRQSGIWHNENDGKYLIYHEDKKEIADNFKERTKLVGRLGDLNCSLEIDDVRNHDNGPFCFRVELDTSVTDKFSFVKNCVTLKMIGKLESILIFTPTAADDHTDITCTVQYHGEECVSSWSRDTSEFWINFNTPKKMFHCDEDKPKSISVSMNLYYIILFNVLFSLALLFESSNICFSCIDFYYVVERSTSNMHKMLKIFYVNINTFLARSQMHSSLWCHR
ncbi:putative myelin-associated glycoprotein-like, partial [Triplophysa rosa]